MKFIPKLGKIFFISIFSILFVVLVFITFSKERIYTLDEILKIQSERTLSAELLYAVKVNDINAAYDESANTYYFSLKKDDYLKMSVDTNEYVDIAIIEDADSRTYSITVYNDTEYYHTTLQLVDIPIVNIIKGAVTDKKFGVTRDDEELVTFQLIDSDYMSNFQKSALYSSVATMRVRGAYSKNYPKKGYKIVLKDDASLLGMRSDDDWALDAIYYNEINNKLASDIWNSINDNQEIDNDLNAEFVEVFIDNQYWGLYTLKELLDVKMTQSKSEGLLLQIHGGTNEDIINQMKMKDYSVYNDDIIFNWRIKSAASDEIIDIFAQKYSEYTLNENKDKALMEYFDLESYINTKILVMLINGRDNIINNLFLSMTDADSKIVLSPWDLDNSFVSVGSDDVADRIIDRIIENAPQVNKLIKERWFELRESMITTEIISGYIQSYSNILSQDNSIVRNRYRWFDQSQSTIEVKQRYYELWNEIEEWIDERITQIDEYFNNWVEY